MTLIKENSEAARISRSLQNVDALKFGKLAAGGSVASIVAMGSNELSELLSGNKEENRSTGTKGINHKDIQHTKALDTKS